MTTVQANGATTKLSQHEILPSPTDVGALANRINFETRSHHDRINKLIGIKLAIAFRDARIYRQGLQSFYHVFAAMERSMFREFEKDTEFSNILKQIWKPELARTEKSEQDLMFYYNDSRSKFEKPILSEQVKFVNHIESVTAEKPYLLLAYMHVMYLALFAGGRIMRSSVSKATGMFPQKDGLRHEDIVKMGANFYTFDVADESLLRIVFKRDYELLTRSYLSEQQKQEIIDESKFIFEQNYRCVSEIERHNLVRLSKKWSYKLVEKSNTIGLFIAALVVLFFVRRILSHIL